MKLAVLALGLWLTGAQGFAAQVCCTEIPTAKASCGNCGNQTSPEHVPRPDCCTSLEAQKDVALAVPKSDFPDRPVVIEFLTDDRSFSPWRPETTDVVTQQAAWRAEGPPLYLRNQVLLI